MTTRADDVAQAGEVLAHERLREEVSYVVRSGHEGDAI